MRVALIGAESTGKSELAKQLVRYFQSQGNSVQLIPEYLRNWCNVHQRTPRQDEQLSIATEQARQVDAASIEASEIAILLADTTALTIAVYSDLLFNDTSLYDMALAHQSSFDTTLLLGLDLPWVADGIQRDGVHMREPVDSLLRTALTRGGITFQVVYGTGEARLHNALRCLGLAEVSKTDEQEPQNRPQRLRNWVCERCSDPVCEHRLFRDLIKK